MRDSAWKLIASTLAGIVATGAASWALLSGSVTRPELVDYVDREVGPIQVSLDGLEVLQRELLVEQRVLRQRVDDFIRRQEDR